MTTYYRVTVHWLAGHGFDVQRRSYMSQLSRLSSQTAAIFIMSNDVEMVAVFPNVASNDDAWVKADTFNCVDSINVQVVNNAAYDHMLSQLRAGDYFFYESRLVQQLEQYVAGNVGVDGPVDVTGTVDSTITGVVRVKVTNTAAEAVPISNSASNPLFVAGEVDVSPAHDAIFAFAPTAGSIFHVAPADGFVFPISPAHDAIFAFAPTAGSIFHVAPADGVVFPISSSYDAPLYTIDAGFTSNNLPTIIRNDVINTSVGLLRRFAVVQDGSVDRGYAPPMYHAMAFQTFTFSSQTFKLPVSVSLHSGVVELGTPSQGIINGITGQSYANQTAYVGVNVQRPIDFPVIVGNAITIGNTHDDPVPVQLAIRQEEELVENQDSPVFFLTSNKERKLSSQARKNSERSLGTKEYELFDISIEKPADITPPVAIPTRKPWALW